MTALRAVVPAYFHPLVSDGWSAMLTVTPHVGAVVLNVDSGPGRVPDAVFVAPVRALAAAGVRVLGYVDTDYGRRPPAAIAEDVRRHVEWYGVVGVFLDRVSAGWECLDHYAAVARSARERGGRFVVFNHGTHPVSGYAEHADLLGTFEGDLAAYVDLALPQWVRTAPADLFLHLVYGVPEECWDDVVGLARLRNVGSAFITDREGANPWDGLPDGPLRWVVNAS